MARPSKYSAELAEGVVELIRQGYNLRAIARALGVSEASLSRWRERYSEFNKAVILATQEQNERACHLSGVRPYRRQTPHLSPQYSLEPTVDTQTLSEEATVRRLPQTWLGLPIRPRPLEYKQTDYYLNPNTERVECIDQNGVLHSCPMWVWEEKQRPKRMPFIFEVI